MRTVRTDPKEGELWTCGDRRSSAGEKVLVVVSISALRSIPYRIAVPVTTWRVDHPEYSWMVMIKPDDDNGLSAASAADAKLCCSYPVNRFKRRVGTISHEQLDAIREAIALCVGYAGR